MKGAWGGAEVGAERRGGLLDSRITYHIQKKQMRQGSQKQFRIDMH